MHNETALIAIKNVWVFLRCYDQDKNQLNFNFLIQFF